VSRIGEVVAAYEAADKRAAAVVVHRDADGPDPQGEVEQALAVQLQPVSGRPVVPVQMIEAWWLLFPGATEAICPLAWRSLLPRRHRNVEAVHDPKKELQRLTRPTKREYAEADSAAIALQIRERQPTAWGTSASYQRLQALAAAL
jgi:hypothetical protein